MDTSGIIAIASTLLAFLAGAWLLVVYLIGTSSRGIPRCRNCDYTLATSRLPDDSPLPHCPECGRNARSHTDLYKRRRSGWKLVAALTCILIAPAFSTAFWFDHARFAKLMPDEVLFRVAPIDKPLNLGLGTALCNELMRRVTVQQVPAHLQTILVQRCARETNLLDNAVVVRPVSYEGAPCSLDIGRVRHPMLGTAELDVRGRLASTAGGGPGAWISRDDFFHGAARDAISGIPSDGTHVVLDVELYSGDTCVWSSTVVRQRTLTRSPDDCLKSHAADLSTCVVKPPVIQLQVGINPHVMIAPPFDYAIKDDFLAIGVDVEVLRGSRVIGRGSYVPRLRGIPGWGLAMDTPESIEIDWEKDEHPIAIDLADRWSIRLTGSRELAMQDYPSHSFIKRPMPSSYWSGVHEVVLTRAVVRERTLFEGEPVVTAELQSD